MKGLKKKDLRKLDHAELMKKLDEFQTELMKEKAASAVRGAVKNPGRIRELRRMIARIKTVTGKS